MEQKIHLTSHLSLVIIVYSHDSFNKGPMVLLSVHKCLKAEVQL